MNDLTPLLALTVNLNLPAVIAVIAGILILIRPALLAYIVAIYLIVIGVLGMIGGV